LYVQFRDLGLKLSNIQIQILEFLKLRAMYGYEIIQNFQEFGITLNTAILYPALKKLEERELIESYKSEQARGGKQRKNYILTKKGFSFIQSLYDMSFVPDLYLEQFQPEIDMIKDKVSKLEDLLVINGINFLDARELLRTKFIFTKIPNSIEFIRYFDFKSTNNLKPKDLIFVNFPFFIHFEITDSVFDYLIDLFTKIKRILKQNGEILILDLYWDRNAISDYFTFLIAGQVKKMGFTINEMKDLLLNQLGFSNFNIFKKEKGVVLFSITLR